MTESNVSSNHPDRADRADAAPSQEMLGGPQGDTTRKDPEEWVTGDEPMTGAQRSYLDTLAREAGEQLPADLTKAEASEHIDRLQAASDRTS
jgi:hypothetical protein